MSPAPGRGTRHQRRARQFQLGIALPYGCGATASSGVLVAYLAASGLPLFASATTALAVGVVDVVVAIGAGVVLILGRRAAAQARIAAVVAVAVAFGASAVLTTTFTPVISGVGLMMMLQPLLALALLVAGVAGALVPDGP